MNPSTETANHSTVDCILLGDVGLKVSRNHDFGLVIHGVENAEQFNNEDVSDYLHRLLLNDSNRNEFFDLIETERLVVCKNVRSQDPTYRRVRGKSSGGKLSQAEYYHHDGCSCPTKPRFVEIRLPHQAIDREIATAIAPFAAVIPAMLAALPASLKDDSWQQIEAQFLAPRSDWPAVDTWDQTQGRITRLVRKEMDAEECRAFFREVDRLANAYVLPWEMGESRLMLNDHDDLSITMQHRRSLQKPKAENDQNGSLVKRWTAEEYPATAE